MQSINNTSIFPATCFQEDKREEVKEWVLAVSMDQKVGLNSFPPKSAKIVVIIIIIIIIIIVIAICGIGRVMDRVVSPLPNH